MDEIWKDVVGFEGLYSVSNLGRVRRDARGRGTTPGFVLKGSVHNKTGHIRVTLNRGHRSTKAARYVHRLVAEAFLGPAPEGKPYTLHKDGVASNNRVENLKWGDQVENGRDAALHGTVARWHATKTHCPQGHAYDAENTHKNAVTNRRSCRTCKREWARRNYGHLPRDVRYPKKEDIND